MPQFPRFFRPAGAIVSLPPLIAASLAGFSPPVWAAAGDTLVTEELLRKIEQRDALIDDLQKRVQELERQVNSSGASRPPAPPSAAAPPGPAAAPGTVPPRQAPAASQPKTAQKTAPGQFEVDEEAAQRALERTLVITGALLLPYGQVEVQPGFFYNRGSRSLPHFVRTNEGEIIALSSDRRTDIIGGNVFMRLGLPLDAQLEFNVPYQSIEQQTALQSTGGVLGTADRKGTGFGDVRLGLAKTVLREKHWWPDVIARFSWDSDTGEIDDNIRLGTGFDELQGSVTVIKRQDPLVFIGSVSYQSAFEKHNVRPGDDLGFALGAILAASPETSLRIILNQDFIDNVERGGKAFRGTDQVRSVLNFGASTILGRGLFLDFTTGVGLTKDAPDYTVGASVAMRFDLPFLPRL